MPGPRPRSAAEERRRHPGEAEAPGQTRHPHRSRHRQLHQEAVAGAAASTPAPSITWKGTSLNEPPSQSILEIGTAVPTAEADVYALGVTFFISATGWRHVSYPDDASREDQRQAIVDKPQRDTPQGATARPPFERELTPPSRKRDHARFNRKPSLHREESWIEDQTLRAQGQPRYVVNASKTVSYVVRRMRCLAAQGGSEADKAQVSLVYWPLASRPGRLDAGLCGMKQPCGLTRCMLVMRR